MVICRPSGCWVPSGMQPLHGLVVCGGQSSRMGTDKSLIRYHEEPQWLHTASLLSNLCENISISCHKEQVSQFAGQFPVVADLPEYSGFGPVGALLTIWAYHPRASLLVVGCDYPLLTMDDLQSLVNSRVEGEYGICFQSNDSIEPLIAVYEMSIKEIVQKAFQQGKYSLKHILGEHGVRTVSSKIPGNIVSADSPEKARQIMEIIARSKH